MGIEQGEFSMQEIMFLVSNISKFTVKKKLKNISLIKEEQELVAITDNYKLISGICEWSISKLGSTEPYQSQDSLSQGLSFLVHAQHVSECNWVLFYINGVLVCSSMCP